jgi:tRNA A-37 threonylcarbamoyl transferase component Bud32
VGGSDDSPTEILPDAGDRAVTVDGEPAVLATGSLIGRTLGKFTVLERLGHGGSGEVFRAEQVQLGRSAVIKVLRRETSAATNRVERFLREAKLASRLDHPYAAHVYAFGAEPDGVLWIAMEHVRGATLDELVVRRGPIPAAVFGPLFGRLCEVVHTAHELGIVHRDIKGSNVMVIERAGQLLPKLLDFGIAKGLDGAVIPGGPDHDDGPDLTGHGSTLGSPHYMSPEQWRSPGDVDARADIYALGVLAYRCVSGKLPFQGIERLALPKAHLELAPPPLANTVPHQVAEVISRALAKQPEARWPSALAFGEALRRAIGGAAPEAVPIFDPATRDAWTRSGPQPIADAVAHVASATTTVEADAALCELVAITCRWLAVLALAQLSSDEVASAEVRERARAVVGRDNGAPWLWLARAVVAEVDGLPGLAAAVAGTEALEALSDRLDDPHRQRSMAALALDIDAAAEALRPLEPLLAYQLVVGRAGGAETWQGTRRRDRDRVVVWGEPLADGQVALLDDTGTVVARLSPLVQVVSPLPSSEPELFLLWRSGRNAARLVAAPWGFERDDEAAAQRLASLTTEDSDTAHDAADDRSPYPGLSAYSVADADRFVGREREVEALTNRLIRAPMIAVLGPSGAGKSSFIHAGLMARLAEQYELITMRPGRHPLHALASLPPIGTSIDSLGSDAAGIVARLRVLGERAPRGLVIVIDQLEELVTLCSDPDERRRFAETLAAAADGPSAPVRVVVTLRDDFATVIESEEAFRGKFEVFVLATPLPEALRRIVTEPARRAAVTVDPRVVDDMVAEVAGRVASLPLLSFTASQLWQTRDRAARKITHDAYVALGGVAGALSTYADQLYNNLARGDQDVARDVFARLVASDGTRIPSPRSELEQLPGAHRVLAHLIDARLLVVREDEGVDIVEVVHECLATRWPRLARWRGEDANDRALLGDVRAATRRWHEAGRRADLLWRGEALRELRKLASRSGALTADERTFAGEADRTERRSRRIRRAIIIAAMASLGAVAVVMAYLSIAANHSRSAAEHSAREARDAAKLAEDRLTAGLIAQGRRELNDNRALASLAYFAEALRAGADSPGLRFMIAIATRGWRDEKLVMSDLEVVAITTLATGFAVGDSTGKLHVFDAGGQPAWDAAIGMGEIGVLRWRGDRITVAARDGVAVIDQGSHAVILRIPIKPVGSANAGPAADEVSVITNEGVAIYDRAGKVRRKLDVSLAISDGEPIWGHDGQIVFLGIGTTIIAVDLTTMKSHQIATDVYAGPRGSADGGTIAYVTRDRVAHILDGDGTPHKTFTPNTRAQTLYVSDPGDRIASVGDRAVTIYDRDGRDLRTVRLSSQDEELVYRLRGDDLWTGSTHGVIRHYHDDVLVASLPSHTQEVEDMRIAGDLAVTVGGDGTVVVSRADARQFIVEPTPCKEGALIYDGIAVGIVCDHQQSVFVGHRLLGSIHGDRLSWIALDPVTQRSAIVGSGITIFDVKGAILASLEEAHRGAIAFEDPEHLLLAPENGRDMMRFTIATKTWEPYLRLAEPATELLTIPAGLLVGEKQQVILYRDRREVRRLALGDELEFLTASADGKWAAAHRKGGGTAIIDATAGELARLLEPVESYGVAAMLDATGDLVIRTSRGTLTVWDRASGDSLIWNLEFLRGAASAAFNSDGKLETVGEHLGLVDIPRETRPVAEILHAIACRVPLRVSGSRLESAPVDCKGSR